jgi:PAS domain S-box-containing protein
LEVRSDGAVPRNDPASFRPPADFSILLKRFFSTLLDTITSPVFFKDTEGRYVGCNDAFVEYLGLPREQIIGHSVYDVAPCELADVYRRKDQELFDHPGIQVYESRVRYADGSLRDVIFRKATLQDEEGRVIGLAGEIFDITNRKHRIVADNTFDWEFWLDPNGRFEYCSPSCERITGHSRDEFMDDPDLLLRIIHPDDLPGFLAHRHEVEDGIHRNAKEIQFRLIHTDGSLRWIGHVCQPVFDGEERFLGNRGSNREITDQKVAEQERDGLLSLLRAVIDNIDTGLILSAADGQVLEMNPAARRMCGYQSMIQAKRHPAEAEATWELLTSSGATLAPKEWPRMKTLRGETFQNWELRIRKKSDGSEWIASFGGAPIRDPQERVAFSVVTIRDVTQRRRAHEELERKVRERTLELARFNRTLQAIVECNQAIIRARSEQDLIREFCRISMRVEGVDLAWVGLAEDDEAKSIRIAAAIGFHQREISRLRISWADDELGQGPAATAIRTGRVCIQASSPADPSLEVSREENLQLGFGASIALPLQSEGHPFGALVLCSARPEIFDVPQIQLLQELANNLSIGIASLRTQKERDRALQTAESRAEQLRAMSLELAQSEQRERRRLAQVLHDDLQQLLVGATFNLEALKGKVHSKTALAALEQLSETITESLGVSRAMTLELSPPAFYEKGLSAGLEWLGSQMHKKHGLKVAIEIIGSVEDIAEQIRMFLFEAVRELLLNVVKHARTDHARVRVRPLGKDEIEITVTDKGVGFDPAGTEGLKTSGFGLFNIREKLRFLRGRMKIESAPERGSRFTLVVPFAGWQEERLDASLKGRNNKSRQKATDEGVTDDHQDPDRR